MNAARRLSTAVSSSSSSSSSPLKRVVVFGGNGWVGSYVCRALLQHGSQVTVCSRSGQPPVDTNNITSSKDDWINQVKYKSFNLEHFNDEDARKKLYDLLSENVTGVVSCVGTFGNPPLDQDSMFEQNGKTNAFLANVAKESGVSNFSYISAYHYPIVKQTVMKGYYRGKLYAEAEIQSSSFDCTTILRPGFISGTRNGIPLWLAGSPMSSMFRSNLVESVRSMIPSFAGDFLETPVDVKDVGTVAAMGALGEIDQGAYGDLGPLRGREIATIAETFQ